MRSKEAAIERCSTKVFVLQKAILQCISGEKPLKICIKEFIFSKIGCTHLVALLKKKDFPRSFISRFLTTNEEHLYFEYQWMAASAFLS